MYPCRSSPNLFLNPSMALADSPNDQLTNSTTLHNVFDMSSHHFVLLPAQQLVLSYHILLTRKHILFPNYPSLNINSCELYPLLVRHRAPFWLPHTETCWYLPGLSTVPLSSSSYQCILCKFYSRHRLRSISKVLSSSLSLSLVAKLVSISVVFNTMP